MVIKIISMKVLKLWIFVDGYCIKIYNYGKIISKIISKLLINSIEFGIIKNRISARNG